jgi:xanthine dehydrogenase YagS FAD-binding subunit
MKSFEYAAPNKLKEASDLLGKRWGETEILAGGTDLVTCLKQGLTAPRRLVSLRNLSELAQIKASRKGIEVGSMVTMGALALNKEVREQFPALVTAVAGIGSAQILAMGTVGGDLCQRPRCWYFRNGFGLFAQQDGTSLARAGENRYHAIFGNDGPALFVSASSLGPALVALGATAKIAGPNGKERDLLVADFFQIPKSEADRETTLQPNEILTGIFIPNRGMKNATYEVRHRHGLDWPYVTASVAFELKGGKAGQARVALGHVAPVPWTSASASQALEGAAVNETTAKACGEAAVTGAKPLSGNGYKIHLVKTAVKRAVLAALAS